MSLPNQSELLTLFSSFLIESGLSAVSIKNYLSDLRNFFRFLDLEKANDYSKVFQNISKYINSYSLQQKTLLTPSATINRRLASIRRFSTFLKAKYSLEEITTQNQIDHNKSQSSSAITSPITSTNNQTTSFSSKKILDQFKQHLISEKKTHSTVKNYLSDLYHYFSWIANHTPYNTHHLEQVLSNEQLLGYVAYLKLTHTSTSVISRRQSSIKKLTHYCFQQGFIPHDPFELVAIEAKIAPLSWLNRLVNKPKSHQNAPKGRLATIYYKYNSFSLTPYFHLALLVLATTTMAFLGYNQVIKNAKPSSAATSLTPPKRQLSFQGRLSDSGGTPINTSVNVSFKLWNNISAGSQLYTTGTCSVTPDAEGIFNTLIGDGVCGSEISQSVFADNRDVYLEVIVGAETLTPRQQIATVGYALNSETLQGYPASSAATINTVPVVDNSGNINIAATSPSIISTSGNFNINGQSLSLTTATNSGGDIVLQPDSLASGQILAIGGTTTEDSFRVTNANLTSGSLISGYIGNNTATGSGNLLMLSSGATESSRFRVTADGRTTISTATASANTAALIVDQNGTGNIFSASSSGINKFNINNSGIINTIDGVGHVIDDITGDLSLDSLGGDLLLGTGDNLQITAASNLIFGGTTSLAETTSAVDSGAFLVGVFDEFANSNSTNVQDVLDDLDAAIGAGSGPFAEGAGIIYPKNSTLDFFIGGQSTASAKFAILNTNSGTPTATISGTTSNAALFYDGNGNISTTNRRSLVLGNSSTYNSTGNILLNPNGVGNIGIGTTLPSNLLTLGSYNAATSNSQKQGLFSTDNNLLAQLDGGLYFGKTGITENQWSLSSHGTNWTADPFFNDNLTSVSMSSNGEYQAAVSTNANYIWVSSDYGKNWNNLSTPAYYTDIAMSSDGKIMAATANNSDNIYVSTDYGENWTTKASARSWSSVTMSSDGKIMTATDDDEGGASADIYISKDYGNTWTAAGQTGTHVWSDVAMSSDGKIMTAVSSTSDYIYVSYDYGASWTTKDSTRNWNGIAMSSDGKIQAATNNGGYIYISTNYGDTWSTTGSVKNWTKIAMSTNGKIMTAVISGDTIYASNNYGTTWSSTGAVKTWNGIAMSSDGKIQLASEYSTTVYHSTANSYIDSGNVGIGTQGPDAKLDSLATTGEQLRLTYTDASAYTGFTVDSTGDLTIDATGSDINFASGDNLNLTSASDLIFGTTTSLAETTSAVDSGAYLVGTFDEFANSNSSNVQAVLNDLDGAIDAVSASSIWLQNTGAIYSKNNTTDFLIGAQSTGSAKFSVLNINTGTPVASISSGLSGVSSFLTATGILATTNNQTLTIGNSTTGNIALGTGTKDLSIDSNTWDVTGAGVASGLTGITSSGTIRFTGLSASAAVYTDGSSNLTSIAPATGVLGFWQRNSGVIAPWAITDSINIGATATASALVHLGGTSGERSFFLEPVAIGFNSAITNPGTGGGLTALQVDGDILPGADDDAFLGRAGTAWNRLYLNNGISNTAGTEQVSILNRQLTGGQWNATTTLRVGDTTASMPTGKEFYVVGDASVSATLFIGGTTDLLGNVTIGNGTGKLDVGTVDPPYTINGEKYATYLSGMIGVKEEVTGNIVTDEYLPNVGYRKTINFNSLAKGSDLWLFGKTTNLKQNLSRMSVLLTPQSQSKVWYTTNTETNTLQIYSSSPTQISYRLTAPRFDDSSWTNTRTAGAEGFIINDDDIIINQNNQNESLSYSADINNIDGTYKLFINQVEKQEIANYSNSLIANLKTGLAVISTLVADNLTINSKLISPLADIENLNSVNATISGTLFADNIKGKTVDKLNEQLGLLEEKYSTASAILSSLQSQYATYSANLLEPLQLSPLSTTSATLPEDLALNTLTSSTIITDDLLANGSIFAKSINSFDTDLFIQPGGDKSIHLLANLMTLYPNGQVAITGDLLVTGNIFANNLDTRTATVSGSLAIGTSSIDASGSANFGEVTTNGLIIAAGEDLAATISGQTNSNSTIGTASIATSSSEITIVNNKINTNTLIYITPISDTANQVLYVKSKNSCDIISDLCTPSFTVAVPQPVTTQTSFNYWLVQTK